MNTESIAICIRALSEQLKDDPEALVEAVEELLGVEAIDLLARVEALEAVAHEQDLLTPERWSEMIKEIRKHVSPEDPDLEEEDTEDALERITREVYSSPPPAIVPYVPSCPNTWIPYTHPGSTSAGGSLIC